MRSPRSPIYGETLASCTRAVYPPRFLLTAVSRGASVFHVLCLGHMYMGSKGFAMCSPQSPTYDENASQLHSRGLPPRFLWMAGHRGASVFHVLCLGHMYMGSKGFAMRSPEARSTAKP
jgi:hypothetical protein